MRIHDIMTREVKAVPPVMSADEAWAEMRLHRIHHLVVEQNGQIVGVVSDRDLGGSRGSSVRKGRAVADLMTQGVVTATPAMTVKQAANLMRGRSIGCLPVVERGQVLGVLTVTDLLELLGRGGSPEGNAHNFSPKQQHRERRMPRVAVRSTR